MNRKLFSPLRLLLILLLAVKIVSADKPPNDSPEIARRAGQLSPFNSLIGDWRGVGQLQRSSAAGAWTEVMSCQWKFDAEHTSILLNVESGRQFEQLKIVHDPARKEFVLHQTGPEVTREYRAKELTKWPDDRIEFVSVPDPDGTIHRCTLQQLSDIRSTILFEKRASASGTFRRSAGIGYTRAGARLAEAGAGQKKCIVTGGLGTIPVTYEGKTYYVCCQGCLQAFNESPAEIVAEYQAMLQKSKPPE